MTSGWRRNLGNVRSFVSNSVGGLRGRKNIAFVGRRRNPDLFPLGYTRPRPEAGTRERAALAAADPYWYVEKRKPISDPQGNRFDIWIKKKN